MTRLRAPKLQTTLIALAIALPVAAHALPEDDAQLIESHDARTLELSLNEGEVVQTAFADRPTCITQGSRKICGAEIRFERNENNSLKKVTATGTPATFEQRPEADQEIVHFSGETLVFDQDAQLLTIDGDGKLSQGRNNMSHEHIEYHLDTGRIILDQGATDAGGRMSIAPETADDE